MCVCVCCVSVCLCVRICSNLHALLSAHMWCSILVHTGRNILLRHCPLACLVLWLLVHCFTCELIASKLSSTGSAPGFACYSTQGRSPRSLGVCRAPLKIIEICDLFPVPWRITKSGPRIHGNLLNDLRSPPRRAKLKFLQNRTSNERHSICCQYIQLPKEGNTYGQNLARNTLFVPIPCCAYQSTHFYPICSQIPHILFRRFPRDAKIH